MRALDRGARLLGGALAVLALTVVVPPATPATAAPGMSAKLTAHSVTMTVADVSPNTPSASHTRQRLTVVLSLRNNTKRVLQIQVAADRGDPIGSQAALDSALAKPRAPSADLVAHVATKPFPITLLPAADADVVFRTTTDIPRDAAICLCHDAIYPLYFTATAISGATSTVVAATQTYVPVFGKTTPKPVLVSWVWPLLDRPHRLTESATGRPVFLDDDLATEVAAGGRLDNLLQVVERVAGKVRMTLVVDPDLIDELAVMSDQPYVVASPSGRGTVPGTGAAAATAWLQRLRTALDEHPGTELDFTPFADPDVESLHENGLSWTASLPSQAALARVTSALGARTPPHDIAWPVGETLSAGTLAELVRQGTRTVVVGEASLPGNDNLRSTTNALSPVRTRAGAVRAAVTSSTIQKYVTGVLEPGAPGVGELPQLVSEVAIRAVQSLHDSHFVVITGPRYVNPDPPTAARAILATADTFWSRSLPLRAASTTVSPVERGPLRAQHNHPGLPADTVNSIAYIKRSVPAIASMFTPADASALLGPLPAAAQRAASSGLLGDPGLSIAESAKLAAGIKRLLNGVSLVKPANGTYTLTASDSSVPITIKNTLGVETHVRISAHAENGLPGFTADSVPARRIAAGSTQQVNIPTHIVRTGRIQVVVLLSTPAGMPLGNELALTVRGTALGTVGVAITTAAGVVLVVALLLRTIGYLRRRNTPRPPVREPDDVTAS